MSFPTQLTVLRIVLVPVFYILLAVLEPQQALWASIVFAVAAASDWWDGHMARSMNLTTSLGAFLDPLADKLLTSAAFIAFATRGYIPWWMVLLVLARDIYLTLLRVVADAMGLKVSTSYFAKVKTFVQMTYIAIALAAVVSIKGTLGPTLEGAARWFVFSNAMYWLMAMVTLLTVASAVQYSYDNWPVLTSSLSRYVLRRSTQKSVSG